MKQMRSGGGMPKGMALPPGMGMPAAPRIAVTPKKKSRSGNPAKRAADEGR